MQRRRCDCIYSWNWRKLSYYSRQSARRLRVYGRLLGSKKNESLHGEEGYINYPHSPVKVLVVPTDEEVMISRDVIKYGGLKDESNETVNENTEAQDA